MKMALRVCFYNFVIWTSEQEWPFNLVFKFRNPALQNLCVQTTLNENLAPEIINLTLQVLTLQANTQAFANCEEAQGAQRNYLNQNATIGEALPRIGHNKRTHAQGAHASHVFEL
jgi:hypothetical protein